MSCTAANHSKTIRRLCQSCQERKARFAFRGRVKADRDHTLCFECFRVERERQRALRLTLSIEMPLVASRALNPAEMAHRRRMLAHLGSQARR